VGPLLFATTIKAHAVPQARAIPIRAKRGKRRYPDDSNAFRTLAVAEFWKAARKAGLKAPLAGPLVLVVGIGLPNPNSDPDNHDKQLRDALVTAGVIATDSFTTLGETVTRRVHGGGERIEVAIYRHDGQSCAPRHPTHA
jgi:Holliday junction resolvase RusA-like endonuclease